VVRTKTAQVRGPRSCPRFHSCLRTSSQELTSICTQWSSSWMVCTAVPAMAVFSSADQPPSQFGLFIVSTSPLHHNPRSKSFPFTGVFQLVRSFNRVLILKVVPTILVSIPHTVSTPKMVSCPHPPNKLDGLPMITSICFLH